MSQNGQFDALLIGAGPSGSTAAALLAEHGHNVLLIEREKFPRYHIGESLLPFTNFKYVGLACACEHRVIHHSARSSAMGPYTAVSLRFYSP